MMWTTEFEPNYTFPILHFRSEDNKPCFHVVTLRSGLGSSLMCVTPGYETWKTEKILINIIS